MAGRSLDKLYLDITNQIIHDMYLYEEIAAGIKSRDKLAKIRIRLHEALDIQLDLLLKIGRQKNGK